MKLITDIKPFADEKEIIRLLGYKVNSIVPQKIKDRIANQIEEGLKLVKPLAIYDIKEITKVTKDEIFIDGHSLIKGKLIAKTLMVSDKIVFFILTIGASLEKRVSELMDEKRMTDAVILDAVGSDSAEQIANALQNYIAREELADNKGLTLRYSPGYCDWDLSGQKILFQILNGSQIGVSLTEKFIMIPRKSISGIIGIGDKEKILENPSPCIKCAKVDCMVRR